MPLFASDSDKRIALEMDDWQEIASLEIDLIGGWRDGSKADLASYFAAHTMPAGFYGHTTYIGGYLARFHPLLDPMCIQDVYGAVESWYVNKGPAYIPAQPILQSQLSRANYVLSTLRSVVCNRLEDFAPDGTDLAILEVLAASQVPLTAEGMRVCASERTIKSRLPILETALYVRRPKGPKGGYIITRYGRQKLTAYKTIYS